MMGRGGGRRLVLLVSLATLLLISFSAVSGVLDENVREFGRFAGRLEHELLDGGVEISADGKAAHVTEGPPLRFKQLVDETTPAERIVDKARSFLRGLATSVENGIPNPGSFLFERKILAGYPKEEKSFGRKGHFFGRHHGSGHSRWAGIRDLIRNHPERIAAAAADLSTTEPLALEEDAISVTPVSKFISKITSIVMTAVEDNNALRVEHSFASSCADALEEQVKIFVKSVKFALRERLCNGDVASMEEQTFCNIFNGQPTMATFQSFWMTNVNPVKVSWHQTSKSAACNSVNLFSSFLDSLQEMEGLARQFSMLLPEVIDTEDKDMEYEHEHNMFHRHRHEHRDHERHWWQRMLHMKPHHFEVYEHGDRERHSGQMRPHQHRHEHGDYERHWWQRMLHMKPHHFEEVYEHGDRERHWGQMKPHHFAESREHGDDEKHWWQRLFGMFHKHKHMRHHGFEHAHENAARDVCFYKSVKYLHRGIRQHLVTTCQSTTFPNVIAACKFAKEHHFLVRAWLAVKMPVWMKAAKSCMHNFEDRHAPDLGISRVEIVERKHIVHGENLASNEAGKTNALQLSTYRPWIPYRPPSEDCAMHHANLVFGKALHLRGNAIGIHHEENELRGLVRTHLIVLEGHPLHRHDVQDAFENLQSVGHSYSGEITDLEDRLTEFVRDARLVRDAVSGEHRALQGVETEMKLFKPHYHRSNFRSSANPRVVSISKRPRFRISAMRKVIDEANREVPVVGFNDVVEDVAGDVDVGAEIKLQDKISKETTENRVDM